MKTRRGVFDDTFESGAKMQTVFGLRPLDRTRVLVRCFRPLGLLVAFGGKAFSQDHPKGYLKWEFQRFGMSFLDFGVPRGLPLEPSF